MKKTLLLYLCFLLCSTTSRCEEILDESNFSLEDAISYAMERNYGLNSKRIDESISQIDVSQSKRELLPNLSASLSQDFTHSNRNTTTENKGWTASGSYNISTAMTLYNGNQNWNTIKKNKLLLKNASTLVAKEQNVLALEVIQSFLSVLKNEELLKYQKELLSTSKQQVSEGGKQFSVGKILESDYLLLDAQYVSNEADIVETECNINQYLLDLKTKMAIDPSLKIGVVHPDTNFDTSSLTLPTLPMVLDEVLTWLPSIKLVEEQVEISKLNTKLAQGKYCPTLSLYGSVGSGYAGSQSWGKQLEDRLTEKAGLTLAIPIWDRGATKSSVKQSKLKEEQALLDREEAYSEVKKEIENLYYTIGANYSRFKASESKHLAQWKVYRVYHAKFEMGSITAVELLQQETNYLSTLNSYIQDKYEYLLNRKALDVYMGREIKL